MESEHPQFFYRYRHLEGDHREWTKQILTESLLYFTSPTDLNDPFDCKVRYKPVSRAALEQQYASSLRNVYPALDGAQIAKMVATHSPRWNPHAFAVDMTQRMQEKANTAGMLCLSATDRNILLWSHYAAGHKGICLKFRPMSLFENALPVRYARDCPEIPVVPTDPSDRIGRAWEQMEAFLFTKALDWAYEQEWRLLDVDDGRGNKEYPEECLAGVVFGASMTKEDKAEVAGWLRGRKSPVQLYQASIVPGAYSLTVEPV
jgi:hypothetical protein